MIMTGRYKVTGQNFNSSDFNSFAFVPQNGQTEKSPKYKGKNKSSGTDFDIIVRNRLPHYERGRLHFSASHGAFQKKLGAFLIFVVHFSIKLGATSGIVVHFRKTVVHL